MENRKVIKISREDFVALMQSEKGAKFSNVTYFVNESASKTDKKNYVTFDGKNHMLQKQVSLNATLNSVYQNKINKVLKEAGISFEWQPNKMTGRYYKDFDKNRAIVYKDGMPETVENAQLVYISETHTKPKSQLFHKGLPVDRKDVWNENFITPANLISDGSQAVKNSVFNHALKAAADLEQRGEFELAEALKDNANKLADNEEFQKLEFHFRTVKVTNIREANIDKVTYILED